MLNKNTIVAAFMVSLSVGGFVGCGREVPLASLSQMSFHSDSRYLSRFSEAEAARVARGENIIATYGKGGTLSTPSSFSQEYGNFTIGAEYKTFIPYTISSDAAKTIIIKVNEKVSELVKMVDASGALLYKSAENVDADGNPVPEQVEGQAPVEGKDVFASVVALQAGRETRFIMRTNIAEDNGVLKLYTVNHTDVKAKVFFEITVIKAGDTINKAEFYPYKNGYLLYSGTKALGSGSIISSQMSAASLPRSLLASAEFLKKSLK